MRNLLKFTKSVSTYQVTCPRSAAACHLTTDIEVKSEGLKAYTISSSSRVTCRVEKSVDLLDLLWRRSFESETTTALLLQSSCQTVAISLQLPLTLSFTKCEVQRAKIDKIHATQGVSQKLIKASFKPKPREQVKKPVEKVEPTLPKVNSVNIRQNRL